MVDNAGVYQCFWEDSEDGTFALDTWALTIQVPGIQLTVIIVHNILNPSPSLPLPPSLSLPPSPSLSLPLPPSPSPLTPPPSPSLPPSLPLSPLPSPLSPYHSLSSLSPLPSLPSPLSLPPSLLTEPPNSFAITSSPDPVPTNPNRTIVPTGSSISLTLKFIADDVVSVNWFRMDIETEIVTQIQFTDNVLYNTTGAVLDTGTNNGFTVSVA